MADQKAIVCGTLIDGVSENPSKDAVVVCEGDRIVEVTPQEDFNAGDTRVIDHSDEVVIPGLIDADRKSVV